MKITIKLDASSMSRASCMLAFYNTVIRGFRQEKFSNSIEYGNAFHKFVEFLARNPGKQNEAISLAIEYFENTPMIVEKRKEWLDSQHLMITCVRYISEFGLEGEFRDFKRLKNDKGEPLVEGTFAIPYYEDDNIIIILCGTIDEIGKLDFGCHCIGDYKTTSYWNQYEYLASFALSHQLMFYVFSIKLLAEQNPGSRFEELIHKRLGAFVEAVFLSQKEDAKFVRSNVFFYPEPQLREFEIGLKNFIKRLARFFASKASRPIREGMLNNSCKGNFGFCPFFNSCSAPEETTREDLLRREFVVKEYNPLEFRK